MGAYLKDHDGFQKAMDAAIRSAVPLSDEIERERKRIAQDERQRCEAQLKSPDILSAVADHLHNQDVVGEDRALQLIYLALTTRQLEQPVSLVLRASSSAGKSYVLSMTARLFPQESMYEFTGMSSRSLLYGNENISHRFLIVYELEGITDPFLDYCIRTLLSEGRLSYGTVTSTPTGPKYVLLVRGTHGVIATTTRDELHRENATRKLVVPMNESPEQTMEVMRIQAKRRQRGRQGRGEDIGPWVAL